VQVLAPRVLGKLPRDAKNMLSMATGAGAIYLLYRTIQAGLNSPAFSMEPVSIASE
uniref:Uncharacterized protein n=1 Tax=Crocodylus porosus TaxID=8502 RepID=A0A7M4E415_CROPO